MYGKKATLNFIKCWLKVASNVVYLTNNDNLALVGNDNKSLYHVDHVFNTSISFQNKVNSLLLQDCSDATVKLNGVINKIVITNCTNITLMLSEKSTPTIVTYNTIGSIEDIEPPLIITMSSSKMLIDGSPYTVLETEQYFCTQ